MEQAKVQIPGAPIREAERIPAENEMSFAAVVPAGLDVIIQDHPAGRECDTEWGIPAASDPGESLASEEEEGGLLDRPAPAKEPHPQVRETVCEWGCIK